MGTNGGIGDRLETYGADGRTEAIANRRRLVETLIGTAALFLVTGLMVLLAGLAQYREARAVAGWPETAGRVVASGAVIAATHGRVMRYQPVVHLVYAYDVGGQMLQSDRIRLEPVPIEASSALGQQLLRDYPAGAAAIVRYDPADPAQAVLLLDPSTRAVTGGAALAGLGLLVALAAALLRSRLPAV